jgi:peroxiredoxin
MKHICCLLILGSCICLNCAPPESKQKEVPIVQTRNDLPRMTVTTSGRASVNLRVQKGKVILILFQPDCDHCQREAQEIRKHLDRFKEYSLYFISADQMNAIEEFGRSYDLLGHSNVNFAATTVDNVLTNFGPIPAPSVYIYADQRLVKKFN